MQSDIEPLSLFVLRHADADHTVEDLDDDERQGSRQRPVQRGAASAETQTSCRRRTLASSLDAHLYMEDTVLVKDLPRSLVESAIQNIANYTIGFLRLGNTSDRVDADLLGSGVLVSAGATRGILTADHVVEVLPKSGRIGLFLGRTTQPESIDSGSIAAVRLGRGQSESSGPDLAVVVLAPHVASAAAARKLFFNLQKRRDQLLNSPPHLRDGAWFAQGFLEQGTVVAPDPVEPGLTK